MKLVIISASFPFGVGGDNNFLQNEMQALSEAFDTVTVVSTGNGVLREDLPSNFKPISVSIKKNVFRAIKAVLLSCNKRSNTAKKELLRLYPNSSSKTRIMQIIKYNYMYLTLKKELCRACADADLIYSYWLSSRAYAVAALKSKGKIQCPIVSRAHGFDLYLERNTYLPFRQFICKQLDCIYFISEHGKRYFQDKYGFISDMPKLEVSYLGLNKESVKRDYIGSNILRIVTCSNIIQVKRLDILIDTLSQIDDFSVEWVHFGNGDLEQKMKNAAQEKLSQKPNITYRFMGYCQNRDVQKYYAEHEIDLFINCSDSEGVPVSIMEAFSYGIPAICRDVGGNSEINRGNNAGYLLAENAEAKEYADALKRFYEAPLEKKIGRRNEVKNIYDTFFSFNAIQSFVKDMREIKY